MKKILLTSITSIGLYISFIFNVIKISVKSPPKFSLISSQLLHVGVFSLFVVAITGFSTGSVLAAQSFFQLSDKGLTGVTGLMVTKAMLVELGPTLTAFMITGRVGAAMCAEIGSMKVTEQIDAMRSMAVDPLNYLIAPRFIAGICMLPLLTIYSCIMGMLGGFLIAVFAFHMSPVNFLDSIPNHISFFDFAAGMTKALIFGCLIVTICCYKGLNTSGGAAGVGRSTTQSVVICYSVILISNFFLTMLLNLTH